MGGLSREQLHILAAAALSRVALIAFGVWQDANLPVRYTDIDYAVYSDAARLILAGRSPYERSNLPLHATPGFAACAGGLVQTLG